MQGRVWGHWHQFLVLQALQACGHLHRFVLGSRDYLHRLILDHVMVCKTKKTLPMSPDPYPSQRVGFGNKTNLLLAHTYFRELHELAKLYNIGNVSFSLVPRFFQLFNILKHVYFSQH